MSERYEENAKGGKVVSAAGRAAQYTDYMASGPMLAKWKSRIEKRRRPVAGWQTIQYDAHGHPIGVVDGFKKQASLDVRVAGARIGAAREEYERNQAVERPVWAKEPK